jgi:hypothetical protein
LRCLIKDASEVTEHLRFLALAATVVAAAMAWEVVTHRNLFSVFGGVPEMVGERGGRFRCQGPFRHPILAGTFAATLLPLMAGLWFRPGRDRALAILGGLSCIFASIVAASSGALLTCIAAVTGLSLWPLHDRMRVVRRAVVLMLIGMAVVMQSPIWYVIAKLSNLFGGTGWHRSYLIDQTVQHFNEWWLIGTSVTAHWAPGGEVLAVDSNNMDITNHYVAQAVQGGLLRLGLFLALIVSCFKIIGRAVRAADDDLSGARLRWAMGVSLACHCTAFISISYFDQIQVFWFWLLAVIAALPAEPADEDAISRERWRHEPAQEFSFL